MNPISPTVFRTIHHVDQATIDGMYTNYAPVFVLTTGRSGSRLVTEILNQCEGLAAFHEPEPTLQYFSNHAFHNQDKPELLRHTIHTARMELVLKTMIRDRIYVEANQCMTFFAPALSSLFPKSRFVHLVRHPGQFVRSAWRKGWHRNDSIWESGRLRNRDEQAWRSWGEVERLAWLWEATNGFIESFKASISGERCLTLRLEDLTSDPRIPEKLALFCGGAAPNLSKMETLLKSRINTFRVSPDEPPNMKKRRDFPEYPDWAPENLAALERHAKRLAPRYGYKLSTKGSTK